MIKFYTLFSGSSGNCTLISTGVTNILIDAGVSCSRISSALKLVGLTPNELDAILITHEHRDHISGVGVLSRRYNIPIYSNNETLTQTMKITGDVLDKNIKSVKPQTKFDVREFEIFSFPISHDAVNPVGYSIFYDNKIYTVATDLGQITDSLLKNICKSDVILLESNHDVDMLKNGTYPYYLKKRILSNHGHLSNNNAAWLATQLAKWGTKNIVLGHLSKENNTADIAYKMSYDMMTKNGIKVGSDTFLSIAMPNEIVEIV